jgi:hypothetical protein
MKRQRKHNQGMGGGGGYVHESAHPVCGLAVKWILDVGVTTAL